MKDDLHELIDGELPDEQAAEVLHLLSVDPEKRSVFRQQMTLQRNLFRNERHQSLSSLEEGQLLDRVMRTAGEESGSVARLTRRGAVLLAIGLLVGGGTGYVGHALADGDKALARSPDTVRIVEAAPVSPALSFNRDSVVSAIRDSLRTEMRVNASTSSAKKPTRTVGRSSRRSSNNDLTGRPLVQRKRTRR
jgi:anti-sigma factor RsiW